MTPVTAADYYSKFMTNPANTKEGTWDIAPVGWTPEKTSLLNSLMMCDPRLGWWKAPGQDAHVADGGAYAPVRRA